MIDYLIKPHGIMRQNVVEIYRDGVLIGTLSEGVEPHSTLHLTTTTPYDASATRVLRQSRTTLAINITQRR